MRSLRTIFFLVSCTIHGQLLAQLDPLYTLYHTNQYLINPAFGGLYESTALSVNSRAQWYGLEGAPFTNTITMEGSLSEYAGVGLKVMNDRIGIWSNTEFMASASYFIKSRYVKLGVALQGGLTAINSDLSRLDPNVLNDPEVGRVMVNSLQPNFGIGFVLHHLNYFFAASVPRLLETSGITAGVNDPRYERQMYFSTGCKLGLLRPNDTKLQTLVRVRGDRISFDLATTYYVTDFIGVGAMLRDYTGASFFGRFRFNRAFSVGYAFELPTNSMLFTNHGTHELTLSYVFAPKDEKVALDRTF